MPIVVPTEVSSPEISSSESEVTEEYSEGEIVDEYSDEDEYDPEKETVIRAKWMFDGAKTLAEARECLKSGIAWLQQLEDDGWELIREITRLLPKS